MKIINPSNKKIITLSVFFVIILVGIFVHKDYGVSIDDQIYLTNGQYYYEYIKSLFTEVNAEKLRSLESLNIFMGGNDILIHPVVYEVPLIALTNFFGIEESKKIFEFSHLLNFLIFYSSLFFFYKIITKRFQSYIFGLIGTILLFLSPRIFAESFYNSRDIFFMSLFIFNMYASFILINNLNYKNSFYFSVTSALLIDAKVIGIIFPILVIFLIFFKKIDKSNFFKENYKYFAYIFFLTFFFIILFWPYLWHNPFTNILFAFTDIIKEQNNLVIMQLYNGDYILSSSSPWHYRLFWFLITTPLIVVILFFIGLLLMIFRVGKRLFLIDQGRENDLWKSNNEMLDFYCLTIFLLSFFITILFNKSQFGGWRHLYYVYPAVIFISIYAVYRILFIYKKNNIKTLISLLIFLNYSYVVYWSIKYHPFQNVYFNIIAKKYSTNNFDLDYWGLSHKLSLEQIIKNNKNYPIKVGTVSFSNLETAHLMLSETDKNKIIIVHDLTEADFLITNFMRRINNNFVIDQDKYLKFHEILIDGRSINTVYKKI